MATRTPRTQGAHHVGLTAPEPLGSGNARHMMCAIPGGIRLELIAA